MAPTSFHERTNHNRRGLIVTVLGPSNDLHPFYLRVHSSQSINPGLVDRVWCVSSRRFELQHTRLLLRHPKMHDNIFNTKCGLPHRSACFNSAAICTSQTFNSSHRAFSRVSPVEASTFSADAVHETLKNGGIVVYVCTCDVWCPCKCWYKFCFVMQCTCLLPPAKLVCPAQTGSTRIQRLLMHFGPSPL